MNFLPRSVSMGNSLGSKTYKLHVKHESGKETMTVDPNISVGQLKGRIGAKFQVPPSQLVLFCNGKMLQGEDTSTLRQARVCNGSKILASRVGAGKQGGVKGGELDREEEERRGEIRMEVEAMEREQEILARLQQMEEQAEELAAEVEKLGQGQMQEALWQEQGAKVQEQGVGARRKESKMAGERLMRLLESLDNISLDASMAKLRGRRKAVATKLNIILDINDKQIKAMDEALKSAKS